MIYPDLTTAQYHNSPSIADWPVTSTIQEISWAGGKIRIRHTKTGQWAPVPFETTVQEGTLWLGLFYNGNWHFAGAERLRPGQTEKDLGSPFDITGGWLYDPGRWGDMANRTLAEGDIAAFCVTSGDMRSQMRPGPRERTDVRLYAVSRNGFLPFMDLNVITPPVTPVNPAPPAPPALEGPTVAALLIELEKIRGEIVDFRAFVERLEYRGEGSLGPLRGVAVLRPSDPVAKKAA